jgi:hypothetical protein
VITLNTSITPSNSSCSSSNSAPLNAIFTLPKR